MPRQPTKTVALPIDVFAHLNTLKVRLVGTLNRIPSNGEIIEFALRHAESDYEVYSAILAGNELTETEDE